MRLAAAGSRQRDQDNHLRRNQRLALSSARDAFENPGAPRLLRRDLAARLGQGAFAQHKQIAGVTRVQVGGPQPARLPNCALRQAGGIAADGGPPPRATSRLGAIAARRGRIP